MKKDFNIVQLNVVQSSLTILRACPAVPFSLANNLNGTSQTFKDALATFEKKQELFNERKKVLDEQKEKDLETADDKKAVETKYKEDLTTLDKEYGESMSEKVSVDFDQYNFDQFSNLEISGEKEVVQQDGKVAKFSYRESYFDLVELEIIKNK